MRILKYPITPGKFEIELPRGAKVLTVQAQRGKGCMWVAVEEEYKTTARRFLGIGTGWSVDRLLNKFKYLGTWQEGPYVWHLFEEEEDKNGS